MICTRCGTPLEPGVAEGLCPRCLMEAGAGSEASAPGPGWTPPEVAELAALFPQLEVIELIGQGGMGAVYKARQPRLDRHVALKVRPPERGAAPQFAERFAREARALARLAHPNIVGIHDFGETNGLFWVVMEFVEGRSLRQLLQGRKLEPSHALHLVPQICEGLEYAHSQGVVHRDIKPENVLVDVFGRVRIADFGLAKLVTEPEQGTLTGTHQVMGSLHYMAPEQMERPGSVDHRADIYSLGVVFYEMLTGELPLGRFPPPSERAQVPQHLDRVILKSLEREPERRYDSALQVKRDVEHPTPVEAPAPAPRAPRAEAAPRPPAPPVFVWILVAGLVGFLCMFLTWGSMPASAYKDLLFGDGMDAFGDPDSPDHPFNDPFFDNAKRRGDAFARNIVLNFGAWDSNVFELPNGLVGLVGVALAVLAGVTLGSGWRPSWLAIALPAGIGAPRSLFFGVTFGGYGGTPGVGCFLSLIAMGVASVAGWQLRPATERPPRPSRRSRKGTTRRRGSIGRGGR